MKIKEKHSKKENLFKKNEMKRFHVSSSHFLILKEIKKKKHINKLVFSFKSITAFPLFSLLLVYVMFIR